MVQYSNMGFLLLSHEFMGVCYYNSEILSCIRVISSIKHGYILSWGALFGVYYQGHSTVFRWVPPLGVYESMLL